MQNLPVATNRRAFLYPGILHKEKKIIMLVWQKREFVAGLADKKEREQAQKPNLTTL